MPVAQTDRWLDAQVGVLGSVLISPELTPRLISETSEADYQGPYRLAYQAIRAVFLDGKPVDPILLDWANRTDGHAISRDSFDDFDHDFPSVIFSASAGKPRLHKFVCDGETVGVPDFGLSGPIPSAF